jgi:isohexenylglutaconyl-CoA hydratase
MASAASYNTIRLARQDGVVHIAFARAERRNALTHEMMLELTGAFTAVGRDDTVRALVLRGEGGAFCAGGDIAAMADMPPAPPAGTEDPMVAAYRQFGHALVLLDNLPCAVIAIVEGPAVGGGFGMVCCSDVVILHRSAKFGIPEPKAGFIASQILPFIVRRLGHGLIRDLAVSGRIIDAGEALQHGLGRLICDDEAAIQAALATVLDEILRMEPQALATVKRLVLSCATDSDIAVLDDAARSLVGLLRRPQAGQGMQAFLGKTPPPWAPAARKAAE